MRKKRFSQSLISFLLAAAMLTCLVGCSSNALNDIFGSYMNQEDEECIGPDGDIYSLTIFDDLPVSSSDMDPLFWVAEGSSGNKVYFLGSIHNADKSAYRIPDKIMDAYLDSDSLAVECDIRAYENDLLAQLSSMSYMMYTDGSTIEDHVDPALYAKMIKFYQDNPSESLDSYGYTLKTLNKCRPSVWCSTFDLILSDNAKIYSDYGIDNHFLTIAAAQGKDIIELESVEFQYSMLNGFSSDLNELILWSYVLSDVESQTVLLRDSYERWRVGDGAAFIVAEDTSTDDDEVYAEIGFTQEQVDALMKEYNTQMLYDRNAAMTDKAEAMISGGQNVFYVVGAAHMVGDTGIITQLRNRGYTVTQLGGMDDISCTGQGDGTGTTTTITTSNETTADSTAATTYGGNNYDDMYDLYLELYEYFGGTTAAQTTNTTRTTRTTVSDDGYGGWGYSG